MTIDSVSENCNMNSYDLGSFLEDIRSIASTLTSVDDEERRAFVRMMSNFHKPFRKKSQNSNTLEYLIHFKDYNTIVRKIYSVPNAYRVGKRGHY